jgi:hypothetical protein
VLRHRLRVGDRAAACIREIVVHVDGCIAAENYAPETLAQALQRFTKARRIAREAVQRYCLESITAHSMSECSPPNWIAVSLDVVADRSTSE